jgi:hypothetical protein
VQQVLQVVLVQLVVLDYLHLYQGQQHITQVAAEAQLS